MGKTKIEWADFTFNPWWGCTKVSPACDFCYAESFSKRVGFSDTGSKFPIWGKDAERRFFSDLHWTQPFTWQRQAVYEGVRKRVFCASMADVMEDRDDLEESRERLYELIEATPMLDWLLLTKRPQNYRRFLPAEWLKTPRPNVWLGTTVESADYLWRADTISTLPAVVTFLSVEPLLGDLSELADHLLGISWVIVGGESGQHARPTQAEWVCRIRDICADRGTSFFFKQWGEYLPATQDGASLSSGVVLNCSNGPVRVGKKKAGRSLDGVEHNQFPDDSFVRR